jgi:hypothetical protein
MPALTRDREVTAATLVALAATRSPGGRFAIAADVRRFAGWHYYRVATLHCEVPADADERSVLRGSGLAADQVRGRSPAAVALAYLDAHLACPPYLLVAHQAGALGSLIRSHAEVCPGLAAARLVDCAELAGHLRGVPSTVPLESYAEEFAVPRSALTHLPRRAELSALLFAALARQEQREERDLQALLAACAPAPRLELTAGPA